MKRLLIALALFGALSGPAWAAAKSSTGDGGLWSVAGTWSPSGVPAAGDDVTILTGDTVIFDNAAGNTCRDGSANCGIALTVQANASLIVGDPGNRLIMRINCTNNNPCISVSGTLLINPGSTLKIQSDAVGGTTPDRLDVNSGGRLIAMGRVLATGTITSVVTDEDVITDPDLAFGLPTRDFEFEDSKANFAVTTADAGEWTNGDVCIDNCYIVRFTSGERRGRWYNTLAPADRPSTRMKVEYESRFNPACVSSIPSTCGLGLTTSGTTADGYGAVYSTGTACVAATDGGACADTGQFVVGTGTTWTTEIANGSRWYCNADGAGAAVRVLRRISNTSLRLERSITSAACGVAGAAAYRLVDDNQPYPFADHSERIAPGDGYEIVLPATIQGATITTGAEPDGSSLTPNAQIRCLSGSLCHFEHASLKWLGKHTNCTDSGVYVEDKSLVFINSEFANGHGLAWICTDAKTAAVTDLKIEGGFFHHQHRQGGVENAHVIQIDSTANPPYQYTDLIIRNNRFDLTNDDAIWLRAPTQRVRVHGNISKYMGSHLASGTGNFVEISGPAAAGTLPSTSYYHSDARIYDNVAMNYGTVGSGQYISYGGSAPFTFAYSEKTQDIAFFGNRISNVQTGGGIAASRDFTLAETDLQTSDGTNNIVASANYISHVAGPGLYGVYKQYSNFIYLFGLDRSVVTIPGIAQGIKEVRGNISVASTDNQTVTSAYTGSSIRPAWLMEHTAHGSTPAPFNFQYHSAVAVTDNLFFSAGNMRLGSTGGGFCGAGGSAVLGDPVVTFSQNYVFGLQGTASSGNQACFHTLLSTGSNSPVVTHNIIFGCPNGAISRNNCGGSPPSWTLNNNLLGGPDTDNNITPDATDVLGQIGFGAGQAFTFKPQIDIGTGTQGPRAAGLVPRESWGRLPVAVGFYGRTAANRRDYDGDGVMDLHDNCPDDFNPSQVKVCP